MENGDEVYISADSIQWYKAIFNTKSTNGHYYIKGYDRGLRFCKKSLNEGDVFKGVFNHNEVFWT